MDSSDNECSSHDSFDEDERGGAGFSTPLPNHPAVVARVKSKVTERLLGVAAALCFVCDRILHTLKVKRCDPARYKPRTDKQVSAAQVVEQLDTLVTQEGRFDLCGTCYNSVTRGRTPSLAVFNGFK